MVHNQRPPRRALLYVPGSDARKITKASRLGADVVILDCEDGVADSQKLEARHNIIAALTHLDFGPTEVLVRINSPDSGLEIDDLREILSQAVPAGIIVPKVERASQLAAILSAMAQYENRTVERGLGLGSAFLETFIAAARAASDDISAELRVRADGTRAAWWTSSSSSSSSSAVDRTVPRSERLTAVGRFALFALIETARGVCNLAEIAAAERLDGLLFGAEDYASDIGAVRSGGNAEVAWARSAVLNHAAANKLPAYDFVSTQWRDSEAVRREASEAAALGFAGKQAIHPDHIGPIHAAFKPSASSIKAAYKVLQDYSVNQEQGTAAFASGGRMVELPHAITAAKLLGRAHLISEREKAVAHWRGQPIPGGDST